MKTFQQLLSEARALVSEITVRELKEKIENSEEITLIDLREKDETEEGKIPGALLIPRSFLESKIENLVKERNTRLILYCGSGNRSLISGKVLKEMGYSNLNSLSGGFNSWKEAGLEIEKSFSDLQLKRYSRQIILSEIGEIGQKKIQKSRILVVGVGGLGSPVLYYLTAAGVGKIGIIDPDLVELSNLHRQIIHNSENIGKPKVFSAKSTLNNLNPEVEIFSYPEKLDSQNIDKILSDYDLVIDGSDNFKTKFLLNEACYRAGKVNIYGSVFRFEGQISIFTGNEGPCYLCLFPKMLPESLKQNCSETGVLGVVPGFIGLLQATEALKLILNIGENLKGKLMIYDLLTNNQQLLKIKKNPFCEVCGNK